jgi:predicted TIM-barrel fold metal-dependent hydrolase
VAPSNNRSTPPRVFDATAGFGPWRTPVLRSLETAGALLDEMDWCGIDEALVYCTAQRFDYPPDGNEHLLRHIAKHPRLHPTIAILPAATREPGTAANVLDELERTGARAVRLFPQDHRYLLDEVSLGDQLVILEARGVPVFVRDTLDRIAPLLRSFPDLVLVSDALGGGPLDRYAWPLAERYPALRFETSSYLVDGGIEEFVRHFGASRLLFASGVPMGPSGGALLQILHADLEERDREAILASNLLDLLDWKGESA